MRRFISFLLFASLVGASATPSAFAADPWTGIWEGTGAFSDTESKDVPCESLGLMTTRQDKILEFYQFGQCGIEAWTDSLDFEIQGDDLWLDGEKVGSLTAQSLSFDLSQPEHEYFYHAEFRHGDAGTVSFRDETRQRLYSSSVSATYHPLD